MSPPAERVNRPALVYVWDADYPWDVRTEKVCRALVEGGFDVHIAARNRAWQAETESLPEGTVHRMPPWRALGRRLDGALGFPAFPNPRWLAHIVRTARQSGARVLMVRDLPLCPTALWAGRLLGLPVVLDMAENYPAMMQEIWDAGRQKRVDVLVRNPRIVKLVERYCVRRVDRTVVVVEESGERLVGLGVERERLAVVSNTPPLARAARAVPRREGEALRLVYLGLLEIPRGVGELIDAVAMLREEGREVRLEIVGEGRDRAIFETRARRLSLTAPTVRFHGYLPHAEALRLVAAAEVGIVPHHADDSWNSTIPNKLFDYMAAGLAVVSSDARPCARILEETGAGLVFRSGDPTSLASALARLTDPALRTRLGEAGIAAVRTRHHWECDTRRLLGLVRGVIGMSAASENAHGAPLSRRATPRSEQSERRSPAPGPAR